jgi:RsiW-degrading membrane proteinase PrsW (M82 family)
LRRARLLLGGKLALVGWLLVFVGVAWVAEKLVGLDGPLNFHPVLALALAGVPAGLWLAFFYLTDRHEPEPKAYVAGVFTLGTLVAGPLADFVVYQLSPPMPLAQNGLAAFAPDRVIHAFLVVGLVQEMCKYVVVRYTVYMSREFDEPMDGVVYMTAVGTGFAMWVNYHRLSELDHTVFLSTGAAQAVVTTLAHASFAGAFGYVLGRVRFSRRSAPVRGAMLFFGLMAAAALNGQFGIVESWVSQTGLEQHAWRAVGYAAGVALAMFALLLLLSSRLLADSPHRRQS